MVLGLHVGYGDEFLLQWCILSCPPRTDQIISQCYRLEWLWKKTTFTENKGLHALHVWFNNCPNLLINPTFVWKGVATVGVVMKNKRDVCGVQGWDVMKTLSLWCAAHFLWQWNKGRLLNHHNRNVRVSVRVYVCVCVGRSISQVQKYKTGFSTVINFIVVKRGHKIWLKEDKILLQIKEQYVICCPIKPGHDTWCSHPNPS